MRTTGLYAPVAGLALLLLSCGSSRRDVSTSASANTPPTATPASTGGQEKCYAEPTDRRPDGWVVAGTMIVTSRARHAVSVELRDTSGRLVESAALVEDSDVISFACKVGGVLAVLEHELAVDGPSTFTILRPSVEDASADVVSLCTKPAELQVDSDGGFHWMFARGVYAERLTSSRWRKWLFELDEQLHGDKVAAERAKREKGDELEAAARAAGLEASCFMLSVL